MTRQYIGARYVPVFADPLQWSSANAYEPLTIVMNNNNTYTSKKAVPTGIQITNEEYWALTGPYNAQLSQLSTDVAALQETMDLIDISPYVPHLKGKKILICGASNEVATVGSGRENTWARKLKDLLNGIATVDIVAQGGAKLEDIIGQVEDNVVGHDIIFIAASGNDPSNDTELGGAPRNASSGTYGYQFNRLKTVITAKYDKLFILRGICPQSKTRTFRSKYPREMYNNYCSQGAAWAGAVYIDGETFYGCVNDENIVSVTHDDNVHFKSPATDKAVVNALAAMCGFYNNNGAVYTAFIKDEYYDSTSYPMMSSLITFESNYSTSNWRVNRIRYSRDSVTIMMRFSAAAAAAAGDVICTLDSGFCDMFNLTNKINKGSLVIFSSTGIGTEIGCRLVGADRTIVAQDAIEDTEALWMTITLDTALMFDAPYDYHA